MKVKSDHRSEFFNLSYWKEEAWKNEGFNGIRIRDLCEYRCDAQPTELWSHTLGARSMCWVHISREEWLWSIYEIIHVFCVDHSSLSSTTAVQIWIISYILQSQCKLEWITWVRTFFGWLLCQSCTLILGHDIGTAIGWLYRKDVRKHYHGQNANFLFPFDRIQCFSSLLILYNKQLCKFCV